MSKSTTSIPQDWHHGFSSCDDEDANSSRTERQREGVEYSVVYTCTVVDSEQAYWAAACLTPQNERHFTFLGEGEHVSGAANIPTCWAIGWPDEWGETVEFKPLTDSLVGTVEQWDLLTDDQLDEMAQ